MSAAEMREVLEGRVSRAVEEVVYRERSFYVRELGPDDTAAWTAAVSLQAPSDADEATRAAGAEAFSAAVLRLTLCDSVGERLYPPGDTTQLKLGPTLRAKLYNAAMAVNGYGAGGEAREEAAKKSDGARG